MSKYKMLIAYDGTDYHGWQAQPDRPTIAGTLEATFGRVFGAKASLLGVSRTDAGVHALGQIATAIIHLDIDAQKLAFAWNNVLPRAITILSCERVADTYTPFDHIAYKTYHYQFCLERPLPYRARYCWHVHNPVDLNLLEQALQVFVGTHDFRSFSTGDDRGEDTIRTINAIHLLYDPIHNAHTIVVQGPTFLRYMVRRIVGAALDVASRQQFSIDFLKEALAVRTPRQPFFTAPAHGLTLYQVTYKKEGIT